MEKKKKVLIIGVIGADVHAVGNKILYHAFTEAGFDVVNLGVMVSQEEYISAAIESGADAIVVRKGTAAPQTDIALDEDLRAPLEPGAQVGTVTVTDSGGDTLILPLVVPDGAARISTAHLWLQLLRAL